MVTDQAAPLVLRAEGQGRHEETRRLWGNRGMRLLVEKARQREGKGAEAQAGAGRVWVGWRRGGRGWGAVGAQWKLPRGVCLSASGSGRWGY